MIAAVRRPGKTLPRAKEIASKWIAEHPDAPQGLTANLEPIMDEAFGSRIDTSGAIRLNEVAFDYFPADHLQSLLPSKSFHLSEKLIRQIAKFRGDAIDVMLRGVKAGKSQKAIAKDAGVSQTAVSIRLRKLGVTAKWIIACEQHKDTVLAWIAGFKHPLVKKDIWAAVFTEWTELGNTSMVSARAGRDQANVSRIIKCMRKYLLEDKVLTSSQIEDLFPVGRIPGYHTLGAHTKPGSFNGRDTL